MHLICAKPKHYPEHPTTLGEHLLRKRKLLCITQADAGTQMGVGECTVMHWEQAATNPPVVHMPAIIAFLGYEPFDAPKNLPDRMRRHRMLHGLTIDAAAGALKVDPGSWGVWESGKVIPWPRFREQLDEFLNN